MTELKSGWKKVKFGDVVNNINLVERNPESAGIDKIVGLEHIDPENLHIRRWNSPEDGTSFTRKFVPGQTLFGKRRAYQRKVAFAEFEGICSGDILTFETKDKGILLPELLPFICQSDAFFDYALGTSAGSLSPRTSWTALKDFEFPLPPLSEQKRIAEILWVADEAVEEFIFAQEKAANLRHKFFLDKCLLSYPQPSLRLLNTTPNGWTVKNLSELIQVRSEKSTPPHQLTEYVGLEHLGSGLFRLLNKADSDSVRSTCSVYEPGDLLYGKLRPNLDKAVIADNAGTCSTEILVINNNGNISNEMLIHHFHYPAFVNWNTHRAFGTKMPRTSLEIIGKYRLPVPPIDIQQKMILQLNEIKLFEESLMKHSDLIRKLQYRIANGFLNGTSNV